MPTRDTPFTGKVTREPEPEPVPVGALRPRQQLSAVRRRAQQHVRQLGRQHQQVQLDQPQPQLGDGGSKLNEFIFQFADFGNTITSRSSAPNESFPNGVTTGANGNTPQTTEQNKYQLRDDFSWHKSGLGGLGHDFKVGVNFINEPHLFITFNTGKGAVFNTHITNDVNGPISLVTLSDGNASANIPMKQFATYFQDDWRVNDRLTLNFGVRYDLMTGYQIDESKNPNFVAIQAAGAAGKLAGIVGLENVGLSPQEDHNNIQPRIGAVYGRQGRRQEHRPRRLGHLHRRRLHQLERAVRGGRLDRSGLRPDVQRQRHQRHQEPGRQLLQGGPAALEHRQPEPGGQHRRVPAVRTVGRSAPAAAVSDAEQPRLVARADQRHGDLG